jgi:hypothetical protein
VTKSSWIWKETAEVIGVLGVIATLIFVALEIRQNTDAVRSATVQDISRWSYDATLLLLDYPELVGAREAGCSGSVSEDQRISLFVYYTALIRIQLNRFQQAQLGILDEEVALNLGGRGGAYRNPYFAEVWSGLKDEFSAGFVEFVERELIPLSQDGCRIGI